MFKFIHAADLHLDSPLRGLARYEGAPVEALRGATRRALDNLVQLAIEEAVAFVLIAGDLYDGDWRDYNTGLFFRRRMADLRRADIPVFIVSGNHDASSTITRHLSLPEGVHLLSSRAPQTLTLDDLSVAIHGQSYRSKAITTDLSAAYPLALPGYFNIGLLHTSLGGRPGHAPYAPCTLDGLRAKGYDYWALGHVHTREVVSQDPWVVFPGNIQGRHARETGPKGCTLVTVDEGEVRAVEQRELDVLRWTRIRFDASGAQHGDEVLRRFREALSDAIREADGRALAVRVEVHGACAAHQSLTTDPERWRSEFRASASDQSSAEVWIEKISLQTRGLVSTNDLAKRDDALADLLRSIEAIEADDDAIDALRPLFDDLRKRLPTALARGDEGLDLTHADTLRAAVEDAKELILAELLGGGGPS